MKILLFLASAITLCASDLRKIENVDHVYIVDKDLVIAVEQYKEPAPEDYYFSKRQGKVIYISSKQWPSSVKEGLANGNLTPLPPKPTNKTIITLKKSDFGSEKDVITMILDIPVNEVIDQLSKKKF